MVDAWTARVSVGRDGRTSPGGIPVRRRYVREHRIVMVMASAPPTPRPRRTSVIARIPGRLRVSVRRRAALTTAQKMENATTEPVPVRSSVQESFISTSHVSIQVLTDFGVSTAETSSARNPTDSRREIVDAPVTEHVLRMVFVNVRMDFVVMLVNSVPVKTIAVEGEHVQTEFASVSTNTLETRARRSGALRTRVNLTVART